MEVAGGVPCGVPRIPRGVHQGHAVIARIPGRPASPLILATLILAGNLYFHFLFVNICTQEALQASAFEKERTAWLERHDEQVRSSALRSHPKVRNTHFPPFAFGERNFTEKYEIC